MSAHIRAQARLCNFRYGRIGMTLELRDLGFSIGERRVARLMAATDINVIRTHQYKRTTDSRHGFPFAPKLLKQNFEAVEPNQKWGLERLENSPAEDFSEQTGGALGLSDISYVWTREGWRYLAVVIDLYSRKIVGLGGQ